MDQTTYNLRVKAFLADMNDRDVDPEDVAEVLRSGEGMRDQWGYLSEHPAQVKAAVAHSIAYKAAPTLPSGELPYLRTALKSAGVDPLSAAGQAIEDLWEAEGLAVALGQVAQVARYKSAAEAQLAKTATFFSDDGRPLARPLRDARGRPLD